MSDLPHDPAEAATGPHDTHEDGDGLGAFRGFVNALELLALFAVAVAALVWAWGRFVA